MNEQLEYDRSLIDLFGGSLKQVFLYITNRCGLRCVQCFYKSELNNLDMNLDVALFHVANCHSLGARKITFLGGEPSLYDYRNNWQNLLVLIDAAKEVGYEHIRLDTNGQFEPAFLHAISDASLSELSFSLDGSDANQNDYLRGNGTFSTSIANIEIAAKLFNVSVTICVGQNNIHSICESVIELARLGVKSFNFHPLLLVGNVQDKYIKGNCISPQEWLSTYALLEAFKRNNTNIQMRIPLRYADGPLSEPAQYCSLRLKDRLHIQPNGSLRICPLSVGTPFQTGTRHGPRYTRVRKYCEHELDIGNKNCKFQSVEDERLIPLCVSYKP